MYRKEFLNGKKQEISRVKLCRKTEGSIFGYVYVIKIVVFTIYNVRNLFSMVVCHFILKICTIENRKSSSSMVKFDLCSCASHANLDSVALHLGRGPISFWTVKVLSGLDGKKGK